MAAPARFSHRVWVQGQSLPVDPASGCLPVWNHFGKAFALVDSSGVIVPCCHDGRTVIPLLPGESFVAADARPLLGLPRTHYVDIGFTPLFRHLEDSDIPSEGFECVDFRKSMIDPDKTVIVFIPTDDPAKPEPVLTAPPDLRGHVDPLNPASYDSLPYISFPSSEAAEQACSTGDSLKDRAGRVIKIVKVPKE